MLADEFAISPDRALEMPFKHFQAFQALAFRRSVERKNMKLRADADQIR